jgi:hypothetical protein
MVGKEGHLRLRLAHGDARSETSKDPAPLVFTITEPVAVGVNQRHKAEGKPTSNTNSSAAEKARFLAHFRRYRAFGWRFRRG